MIKNEKGLRPLFLIANFTFMRIAFKILIIAAALSSACSVRPEGQLVRYQGEAQGTTYQITTVVENPESSFESQIDSIFKAVDRSMNPWHPSSLISKLNEGDTTVRVDALFLEVFKSARDIHNATDGRFDITVGALVNAYGFGPTGPLRVDSARVDSLMKYVGMDKVRIENGRVMTDPAGMVFDFNAIAQGYTVDLLAEFLENEGVTNYLVEVGGELRAKGVNLEGRIWRVGIDKPTKERGEDPFQAIVALPGKSLATSGNYRKFRVDEVTGQKFVHTVDPTTGYTVQQNLLSATVVADKAMIADGYATAFMVMGLKSSIELVESRDDLDAMFVYSNDQGEWEVYQSPGFENLIR